MFSEGKTMSHQVIESRSGTCFLGTVIEKRVVKILKQF